MSKEVISIISVVCVFMIGIYKTYHKKMKERAEKTATRADDIALMIADLVIPLIEKITENKEQLKMIAQNEVEKNLKKIGEEVSEKTVIKAVEKSLEKKRI